MSERLLIAFGISAVAHFAIERGLELLPQLEEQKPVQPITVTVIEPPPPPPPVVEETPPEPEPPKPEPTPQPKPTPTPPHPQPKAASIATAKADTPAPDHPAVQASGDTSGDGPVFGVSMESTSQQGTAPMPTGSTTAPKGQAAPAKSAAVAAIGAQDATKLPLPQGRCFGQYTDEARAAGLEGTVVLDLTVDETGRAREITVVQGLDHGLSDAAKRAMIACHFTPGEKDGKPVAVRIRGFKIQFVLSEAR
ncbi:MAG: energy transducer TonB [Kofleriaceae bacterium]